MKIIFLGTADFACPALGALYKTHGIEIVAVYTAPSKQAGRGYKETKSPVHILAEKLGLKVMTPASLKSKDIQDEFSAFRPDLAVVAAYGLLLPQAILDIPKFGCINIHPSKLPRWRGAAPIQRTIMAGDTETSICIMQMDLGLDTGDLLLEKDYQVPNNMTSGDLFTWMANESAPLLLDSIELIKTRKATPKKQSNIGITYAAKIEKSEARLDFSMDAKELYNKIRGLSPYPYAYFEYKGEKIKVLEAELVVDGASGRLGEVIDDELLIKCGKDALRLLKLQRPGKTPLEAAEFLRGFEIPKNEVL